MLINQFFLGEWVKWLLGDVNHYNMYDVAFDKGMNDVCEKLSESHCKKN